MIPCLLIFSFLFEAVFTNLISINSFLTPLFLITTLTLIYPYFNNRNININYIIVCLILGLFYDIAFADSIFVNTVSFGIIGGIVILCYNYVKYNIYTSNIINIIILITYRIITYIILLSINHITFNNKIFFSGIYNSLLINILYGIIMYCIIEVIAKILGKKRVE